MKDIYALLTAHNIPFERFDHPPVFTSAQAQELLSHIPGSHAKNLFLRDRKGERHLLVLVGYEKNVDLKALGTLVGGIKLSFASPERLQQHLGIEPGSVSLLSLINDTDHRVEVFVDESVWQADTLQCHPLINTTMLVIPHAGIEKFLQATGHEPHIITIPGDA